MCESFCPEEWECDYDEIYCPNTYLNDGCEIPGYCLPRFDENGCESSCPECDHDEIWCSDGYFGEIGCQHGYCIHYMDSTSTCQDDWDYWHDYSTFETNCIDYKGISFGMASVCISQKYKYKIKNAPKPPQNNISIIISHIQVTEIADKLSQMTLILDLEINWDDSRIQLVKDKVPIFLGNEDQIKIWSPRFRIGTNLVSHNKQMDDETM